MEVLLSLSRHCTEPLSQWLQVSKTAVAVAALALGGGGVVFVASSVFVMSCKRWALGEVTVVCVSLGTHPLSSRCYVVFVHPGASFTRWLPV